MNNEKYWSDDRDNSESRVMPLFPLAPPPTVSHVRGAIKVNVMSGTAVYVRSVNDNVEGHIRYGTRLISLTAEVRLGDDGNWHVTPPAPGHNPTKYPQFIDRAEQFRGTGVSARPRGYIFEAVEATIKLFADGSPELFNAAEVAFCDRKLKELIFERDANIAKLKQTEDSIRVFYRRKERAQS